MDPDATWALMLESCANDDSDSAIEAANSLLNWLRRGGFPPRMTVGTNPSSLVIQQLQNQRAIAIATAMEVLSSNQPQAE